MLATNIQVEASSHQMLQLKSIIEAIDFKNSFTPQRHTEISLLVRTKNQRVLDSAFNNSFWTERLTGLPSLTLVGQSILYNKMTLIGMSLQLKEHTQVITGVGQP